MWITRVSINNPVFATMVMVGIAVLGIFSYSRLRVEQMPDVSAAVRARADRAIPGASPEAVETDVTKPLEYAINSVSGVKPHPLATRARAQSQVFAEFRLDTDMTRAMQDVRDKIALVRPGFPRDVKDPLVIRADNENQQPVVSLAVMSPTMGLRELTSLTDQTIVKGARERAGRRAHRRQRPRDAADPDPDQAERADRARHRRRPGDERDPRREPGRAGRPHHARPERRDRARRRQDQGPGAVRRGSSSRSRAAAPVYLSQVADVIDGEKEETSLARINGRPSITLDIQKAQDANIVDTGRGVREAVEALKKRLPTDVELRIVYSTAEQVEKSVNRVKQTIVEGALLTVLIVFLFLHSWRSTIITGLTLPIARDRDVHRAVRVRLHAQLPDADGAVAVHRPPDRRRDRRAREHRAPPRRWARTTARRRARAPTRSASR